MDRITISGEELIKEEKTKECLDDSTITKEVANLKFIKIKKEKLGFITKIIGVIEIALFAFLVILLIKKYNNQFSNGLIFDYVKLFGGWIAIKTLGNYGQWSGAVLGRACFYVFLLGTLLNVFFGLLLGIGLAPIF
jgi:small-conductance mechanosensitive channel